MGQHGTKLIKDRGSERKLFGYQFEKHSGEEIVFVTMKSSLGMDVWTIGVMPGLATMSGVGVLEDKKPEGYLVSLCRDTECGEQ